MWCIRKLNELSSHDFYYIARLRVDTFMVEQQRLYHELDEADLLAKHVYYQRDGQILAYARMFLADGYFTFNRFVTHPCVRGTGLGDQLIKLIVYHAQNHYAEYPIKIEAQRQVLKFYQQHGFQIQGAPYICDGVAFVQMVFSHNSQDMQNTSD